MGELWANKKHVEGRLSRRPFVRQWGGSWTKVEKGSALLVVKRIYCGAMRIRAFRFNAYSTEITELVVA